MAYRVLDYVAYTEWFDSYLPDFVLGFAFFTGLIFAVLSRRMGLKRSVGMVAVSLGAALASGLVWWERMNGYSIRNLGPIAVGFAIIILGGVIYQSVKLTGGSWAGSGIAIGACLLVGWMLGFDWPVATEIVQAIAGATLTVGILAFLLHRHGVGGRAHLRYDTLRGVDRDLNEIHEGQRLSQHLGAGLRRMKRWATALGEHPDRADDVMLQLKRMLPAQGWLTERLARLRERAHRVKAGHVARIDELRRQVSRMSAADKRRVAIEMSARYTELKLDVRVERLDKVCADNERRIRQITRSAADFLKRGEHRKVVDLIAQAEKLQRHNSKLFQAIDRTDRKLVIVAQRAARLENKTPPSTP